MDNLFIIDKNLMRAVIDTIKSLKVDTSDFYEADKWVGVVTLLETAMNPPKSEEKEEKINIPLEGET